MKLCVLFPGIGYHCNKPLLHFSREMAVNCGYTVRELKYTDFPEGAKGNEEKMRIAADHALEQSEQQLADLDYSKYEKIIFIGKSIGTAACLAYREKHYINAECFLLTPLELTFEYPSENCTAFHGTSDPWADTSAIERLCKENNVTLYKYENANHSLVTADPDKNSIIVSDVIKKIGDMI